MNLNYMIDPVWIKIPWGALPMEFRKDPSGLSLSRAVSIFTALFRTHPVEVLRPRPTPRSLERIPQFMREAIVREAAAAERTKDGK